MPTSLFLLNFLRYIRLGQGYILAYSISSKNSFEEVPRFREQILRVKDSDQIPMILCGNKCDLGDNERKVTKTEAEEMAKTWGIPFFETSALAKINVEELFFTLVREVRRIFSSQKDQQQTTSPGKIRSPRKKPCSIV